MRARNGSRILLAVRAGAAILVLIWHAGLTDARAADAPSAPIASPPGDTLLLEVVINGFSTGNVADVIRDGDRLLITQEDLSEIGLRVPSATQPVAGKFYALDSLPNVSARVDETTQILYITADDSALLARELRVGAPQISGKPVESGTGFTLNYDVNGAVTNGQTYGSGLFEGRIFSPFGVASTDFIALAHPEFDGAGRSLIRLDSSYVYSDYDSQNRYLLGDLITGGLAWTRPVHLGGVQVTRDFSMRPDLITFPLPTVTGSATVPSTVDVLVNGTRTLSQQVQPGPFAVSQLPVITGAGQVQVTVTNALGQQVTNTSPFYASASLLAPELDTYSMEAGFFRRDWGAVSNDYGNFAVSGTYRRGLTNELTFEAHAEATKGQGMAGAGLVANLFDLAVLNVDGAGSTFRGRTGGEVVLGVQRVGPIFSVGVQAIVATRKFADIAETEGTPVPTRQITASISATLGKWGSAGIAWAEINQPGSLVLGSIGDAPSINPPSPPGEPPDIGPVRVIPGQISEILTASYTVTLFGGAFLYATGFHDFAHAGTGASVGLTVPLGVRDSVSASGIYQSSAPLGGQFQAERSVSDVGDWGYQAYASHDDHQFGQLQYKSPWGLFTAGLDHIHSETTVRAEAQGAISFLDDQLFPTNTVTDSFAVVDTNGVSDVHVSYENRPAGVTDSSGKLLVPDLLAWQDNHLAIEPADVPVESQVPTIAQTVRPPDRSGVVVGFPITKTHGAVLALVDEAGKPIPLGSTATLEATGVVEPVGYEGETFVKNLGAENRVDVQLPYGDHCVVSFSFTPAPGEIPRIGPLTCRKQNL